MSTRSPAGAEPSAGPPRERRHRFFQGLQKTGRGLRLPIAVLPAAGALNRLGRPDVFGEDGLGWTDASGVMVGAGGRAARRFAGAAAAVLRGCAVIGVAKKADGSTALAAVAGFLVHYNVLRQFPRDRPEGSEAVARVGCREGRTGR
ncbi:hypothetical protein APS67_000785 [Streptomyces sp. AVP053U2]|nr:hypothetical protein APS67_000785 [Streptomyces sp. AVP053U2]